MESEVQRHHTQRAGTSSRSKFSKVSAAVIVYCKFSSELTFQKFCQYRPFFAIEPRFRKFSKVSAVVIVYNKLHSKLISEKSHQLRPPLAIEPHFRTRK